MSSGERRRRLADAGLVVGEPIYFVETACPFAYVWRDGAAPVAVDLRSGSVSSRLDRYRVDVPPALLTP